MMTEYKDTLLEQEYVDQQTLDLLFKYVKNGEREPFREIFLKLHDYDQAKLFELLYPENKRKIAKVLEPFEFAGLFEYMDFANQKEAFEYLPHDYLTEVFSELSDDDVVDLLEQYDPEERGDILNQMHLQDRIDIEMLLAYAPQTAGSIMTTEYISVHETDTINYVIQYLRKIGHQKETIYYTYVVNEHNQLTGVLSLRDILLSPATEMVQNIMNAHPVSVDANMDQEEVASIIQDYDLLAIPVVNQSNQLIGIVTVDDVIDIIHDEVEEDFRKFSGISGDDEADGDQTVFSIAKQRSPWIIILIFLGLGSASLIAAFEETLARVVSLAAFMPIILDTAGNVGTQSLAVSVRKITLGDKDDESILSIITKEFVAGFMIGILASITIGVISYFMFGNLILSLIVGGSLLVTLSISTVVGATIPLLFNAIGIDPAVASGPFITTICDGFALITYFTLATQLIHHLV